MSSRIDLTGQKFGRLEVKEFAGVSNNCQSLWNCVCDCGNTKRVYGGALKGGHTKSCGCLNAELSSARKTTHGGRNSKEYGVWSRMKDRCYNNGAPKYKNYGGRGIRVCDRWLHSFENFLEDMGSRPTGTSLDRKDNNGDYCPENCRWATQEEQQNNRSDNHWMRYKGELKTITQWALIFNIKRATLYARHYLLGWSVRKSLTAPLMGHRRKHK